MNHTTHTTAKTVCTLISLCALLRAYYHKQDCNLVPFPFLQSVYWGLPGTSHPPFLYLFLAGWLTFLECPPGGAVERHLYYTTKCDTCCSGYGNLSHRGSSIWMKFLFLNEVLSFYWIQSYLPLTELVVCKYCIVWLMGWRNGLNDVPFPEYLKYSIQT